MKASITLERDDLETLAESLVWADYVQPKYRSHISEKLRRIRGELLAALVVHSFVTEAELNRVEGMFVEGCPSGPYGDWEKVKAEINSIHEAANAARIGNTLSTTSATGDGGE